MSPKRVSVQTGEFIPASHEHPWSTDWAGVLGAQQGEERGEGECGRGAHLKMGRPEPKGWLQVWAKRLEGAGTNAAWVGAERPRGLGDRTGERITGYPKEYGNV